MHRYFISYVYSLTPSNYGFGHRILDVKALLDTQTDLEEVFNLLATELGTTNLTLLTIILLRED